MKGLHATTQLLLQFLPIRAFSHRKSIVIYRAPAVPSHSRFFKMNSRRRNRNNRSPPPNFLGQIIPLGVQEFVSGEDDFTTRVDVVNRQPHYFRYLVEFLQVDWPQKWVSPLRLRPIPPEDTVDVRRDSGIGFHTGTILKELDNGRFLIYIHKTRERITTVARKLRRHRYYTWNNGGWRYQT